MTSQLREILEIIEPQAVIEGAGVRLKRSMATRRLDYLDPFLLFDHFGSDNPDDYLAGFPMHPHRGIETVTYMLAGLVHHRDSIGNSGSIEGGDVQWMTAGRGILHEEMPQPRQGEMAGFQLWVNLPAKLKMTQPRYQEIASAPNGSFDQPIERGHSAFAYVFEGEGTFGITDEGDGETVSHPKLVVFDDGDHVKVRATKESVRFLLISGKPLYESIARYGPFVMNTKEEIQQALRDLRNGTFV
jgi:redox-sensitive bicupin YhaK (pirin superfamily)